MHATTFKHYLLNARPLKPPVKERAPPAISVCCTSFRVTLSKTTPSMVDSGQPAITMPASAVAVMLVKRTSEIVPTCKPSQEKDLPQPLLCKCSTLTHLATLLVIAAAGAQLLPGGNRALGCKPISTQHPFA